MQRKEGGCIFFKGVFVCRVEIKTHLFGEIIDIINEKRLFKQYLSV
jgi:hypothetical protein